MTRSLSICRHQNWNYWLLHNNCILNQTYYEIQMNNLLWET